MSAEGTPNVTVVPVKRYDATITLDNLLTSLTQSTGKLTEAHQRAATNPELAQHLQTLGDLAGQLKEVVGKINQIDPALLAPKSGRPSGG